MATDLDCLTVYIDGYTQATQPERCFYVPTRLLGLGILHGHGHGPQKHSRALTIGKIMEEVQAPAPAPLEGAPTDANSAPADMNSAPIHAPPESPPAVANAAEATGAHATTDQDAGENSASSPAVAGAGKAEESRLDGGNAAIRPGGGPPRQGPNEAEKVIRDFVEAMARLARTHRDAVREAGGIPPLVTLLHSGTSEVQALTAAVLRDLASDNSANRDAILKAGGLDELVVMVSRDPRSPEAGEAAGALRSLSNGFPAGCRAIIEARGVDALVEMIAQGEPGSSSAIQATGVLAHLAQAEERNCDAILQAGGVRQLISLLSRAHAKSDAAARRLAPEQKARLDKTAEEVANALWQLAAKAPSCNAAIRKANAVLPLVETLLRSGLGSSAAQFASKGIIELVQSDEAAKMAALDAIYKASQHESFSGHGWSLSFPLLRHLLHGAAERLIAKEEQHASPTGIQYAIDIGKAVELPQKRLDAARSAWDDAQSKQKREKLSQQSEARRKAKEDEQTARDAKRKVQEEEANSLTEEVEVQQQAAGRGKRKDRAAVPESSAAAPSTTSKSAAGNGALAHMPEATKTASASRTSTVTKGTTNGAPASARGEAKSRVEARKSSKHADVRSGEKGSESHRPRKASSPAKSRKGSFSARQSPALAMSSVVGGAGSDASGLAFIPRSQLLEKIEHIAALNKTAPPMPNHSLGIAPADAIESWHNRWEHKYMSMLSGHEQGFSGFKAEERTGGNGSGLGAFASPSAPRRTEDLP